MTRLNIDPARLEALAGRLDSLAAEVRSIAGVLQAPKIASLRLYSPATHAEPIIHVAVIYQHPEAVHGLRVTVQDDLGFVGQFLSTGNPDSVTIDSGLKLSRALHAGTYVVDAIASADGEHFAQPGAVGTLRAQMNIPPEDFASLQPA